MTPERLLELLGKHAPEQLIGDVYVKPAGLAWLLGIELKTLYNRRQVGAPGALPDAVEFPGRPLYEVQVVAAWITRAEEKGRAAAGGVPESSRSCLVPGRRRMGQRAA